MSTDGERYDTKSNVKLGEFQSQLACVSSHTDGLWNNETVCLWMTIYTLPSQGLSTLAKKVTAATRVMQSSSYELSILVSGKVKCKQSKATT